jgi:hypothetical protein
MLALLILVPLLCILRLLVRLLGDLRVLYWQWFFEIRLLSQNSTTFPRNIRLLSVNLSVIIVSLWASLLQYELIIILGSGSGNGLLGGYRLLASNFAGWLPAIMNSLGCRRLASNCAGWLPAMSSSICGYFGILTVLPSINKVQCRLSTECIAEHFVVRCE